MIRKSAKERAYLSRKRQALWAKLETMAQREKDMVIALHLGAPDAAGKAAFCRQEAAKLQEKIKMLDRGVSRQRAWARGKEM